MTAGASTPEGAASLMERFRSAIGSIGAPRNLAIAEIQQRIAACDSPRELRAMAEPLRAQARAIAVKRSRERLEGSKNTWEDSDQAFAVARQAEILATTLEEKAAKLEAHAEWVAQRDAAGDDLAMVATAADARADAHRNALHSRLAAVRATRAELLQLEQAIPRIDARLTDARSRLQAARDRAADEVLRAAIEGAGPAKPEKLEALAQEVATLETAHAKANDRVAVLQSREYAEQEVSKAECATYGRAKFDALSARLQAALLEHRALFEEWAAWGVIASGGGLPKAAFLVPVDAKAAALRVEAIGTEVRP